MSRLFLEQICQKFGSTVALDEVDLEIADGEFLVLLGPSGCGKSTLLRIISGLLAPTSGRVIVDGTDVTSMPAGERNLAMVFQSYALYPHLNVARNLGFGLQVRHRPKSEISVRVGEVADQLGLTELLERRPKELSGGQRQRVALGRAMVRDPKAFLMDEPLSNLDAQLRTAMRLELSALHRRLKTTFIYVTHDQVEAMTMATKIAVLNQGRLEQFGTPTEIYDEPKSTFVAKFMGSPPMNLVPAKVISRNGKVRLAVADGIDVEIAEGNTDVRDVLLGVRPEHLCLSSGRDPGSEFRGEVNAIENLGSEEIAFCDVGEARLAMRKPRPLGLDVGDSVTLTAPRNRLYLFDPSSTRRIVWVDDARARQGNRQLVQAAPQAAAL